MPRIGFGWDCHALARSDKPFMIGGVEIRSDFAPVAHSDGDALLHAVIDALLGACARGDIGHLFPASSEEWKGASSSLLVEKTLEYLGAVEIGNLDCTVVLESPRLAPYIEKMRETIAHLLKTDIDRVSVKAKTFEGEEFRIEAFAVVLLEK